MIDPTKLCQIEIPVSNIERSLEFYDKVMGWPATPTELHNYQILKVPADSSFGIAIIPVPDSSANTPNRSRNGLTLYFGVDDPDTICSLCKKHGGQVKVSRDLPGYGHIRHITDPDGQRFGLFQKNCDLGL